MLERLDQLLANRRAALEPATDAYRVLPEGLLFAGVSVDALAGRFMVSLRNTELPPNLREWLLASGADVFVKHLSMGDKSAPEPLRLPQQPLQFTVRENGVRYWLDMQSGYSQGLFIDQRDNRAQLRRLCHPGMTVLNLFAYTGAFSVCAALEDAVTTTLDLARPCLERCRENMRANDVDPEKHFFCRGDAMHWLSTFARQGRNFHIIVLDPPTFSRDAKGHVWRADRDYTELVRRATRCLEPRGHILCTTNCRSMSAADFRQMVSTASPTTACLEEAPMPFDFSPETYLKTLWIHS